MSAGERVTAVAVAPLWALCAGGWGVASAVLLTWSTVRGTRWIER